MAAPAVGWLASRLLLASMVVEVAGYHSQWEPELFAPLASQLSTVMLELGWTGDREASQGKLIPACVLGVLISVCISRLRIK